MADNITIETITKRLRDKNIGENKIAEVYKSFDIANYIHKDQERESGEPYIIHPLNVANILLDNEIYAPDLISAALLHDTIEDATEEFSKERIASEINPTVSELVDGVTKISGLDFYGEGYKNKLSKEELLKLKQDLANSNIRKLIASLNKDYRVIVLKLADRTHNMRTLNFKKKEEKKIENAQETKNVFVPLADLLGMYQLKTELDETSLKYIDPTNYVIIKRDIEKLLNERESYYNEIISNIGENLSKENIPFRIVLRQKSIVSVYKQIKQQGYKIEDIYDLFYPKIIINGTARKCFDILGMVHENYRPFNGRFRDYINNPRTNYYQALHTTVSDSKNSSFKVKIKNDDMDKISAYGITAFWNLENGLTYEETQKKLNEDSSLFKALSRINETCTSDEEFSKLINKIILTDHYYTYYPDAKSTEVRAGSNAREAVEQMYPDDLGKMTGILVNGKRVPFDYPIETGDQVAIITTGQIDKNWVEQVNNSDKPMQKIFLPRK